MEFISNLICKLTCRPSQMTFIQLYIWMNRTLYPAFFCSSPLFPSSPSLFPSSLLSLHPTLKPARH